MATLQVTAAGSILSPCTGICRLAANGLCEGCLRTGSEIAAWTAMSDVERTRMMEIDLPLRHLSDSPGALSARVTSPQDILAQVRDSLHRLDAPPCGPAWNSAELAEHHEASAEHIAAAVLVALVPRHDGVRVLLTRRNGTMRQHAGQVSFPGGRIEPFDADACAGAVRETVEETGIPASRLTPIGYLDPLVTITGFRVQPVVAILTPDYIIQPDPREVEAVFEVPFNDLMTPANLKRTQVKVQGRHREVLEFVGPGFTGHRIWGATASILFNLRERIHRSETTKRPIATSQDPHRKTRSNE